VQGNDKVRVVVVAVVLQIPEVHNLVTIRAKQDIDLLFHFVSAMIAGEPNFHLLNSACGEVRSDCSLLQPLAPA
jgi:hypothetical protein